MFQELNPWLGILDQKLNLVCFANLLIALHTDPSRSFTKIMYRSFFRLMTWQFRLIVSKNYLFIFIISFSSLATSLTKQYLRFHNDLYWWWIIFWITFICIFIFLFAHSLTILLQLLSCCFVLPFYYPFLYVFSLPFPSFFSLPSYCWPLWTLLSIPSGGNQGERKY